MRDIDSNHCANLADVDLWRVTWQLNQLKQQIAEKALEKEEAATFELGQLCLDYSTLLKEYEHLYSMSNAYRSDRKKEDEKQRIE